MSKSSTWHDRRPARLACLRRGLGLAFALRRGAVVFFFVAVLLLVFFLEVVVFLVFFTGLQTVLGITINLLFIR